MDDELHGTQEQEILNLMGRMDEDAQAAMGKLIALLSTFPKGAQLPPQEELKEFVEQARLENIRIRLGGTVGQVLPFPMANESWTKHAYPLQQITIKLQGTRHSTRPDVIDQLETVLARLKSGDVAGTSHDDDFGYVFTVQAASPGPSFFDEPASDN